LDAVKITLHVDEALLARVMEAAGVKSKTKAIDLALREMDRKARLLSLCSEGLGLGADELKETLDPAYDLHAMRRLEGPISYGHKPRAG
jgi:Arc/MetJ family transcription regulator